MSRQNNALPQMVEPLWSTYIHQKGARLGLPVTGTFELTPRCNFNCNMCYVHQTETQAAQGGRRELTTAEWLAIAEEARKAGMVFLLLTGGEPLLRPDFPELLHALKNMGFLVSVNSNGSLLRGKLLEAVKQDPPLRFNITLYGGSNAAYERLCGRAMFQEVVDNLRALKDAGIPVRLNVSVTPDNKDDVPEIFRLARELGLHTKASTYMYPPVRLGDGRPGDAPHRFAPEDAARYMLLCREQQFTLEELRASAAGVPLSDGDECTGNAEGEPVLCRAGRSSFWLTWDGRMIPCGMMASPGTPVLEQGFSAAWRSVRTEVEAIRLPAACAGCALRRHCNLCAASCFAETGDYDRKPNYICSLTHTLCRITREKYGTED